MRLGAGHMRFDARNLGLEAFDSTLKLLDRHGIKVLLSKLDQRVAGLAGEQVVQVHAEPFDPSARSVNKRGAVSTSVPASMKAIVGPQPDGAEELAVVDRQVPRPGPGEVLIEVAAAGVNRPDILQRRGLYPPPPGASRTGVKPLALMLGDAPLARRA